MSYSDEKFEVEKILKRRVKNGTVEYRLKWLNYPNKYNQWTPIGMMDCDELVREYEVSRFLEIIGVKMTKNGVEYGVKLSLGNFFDLIDSRKVLNMWPNAILDFLESKIVFKMPAQSAASPEIQLAENVVGFPDEIIGCTNLNNDLEYLCEWKTHITAFKLVSSVDAKTHFPHLVVGYLENNLDFPPIQQTDQKRIMTRAFKKYAQQQGISLDSKVTIVRNIGLEKTLLQKRAGPIIQRRNTAGASNAATASTSLQNQAGQINQRRNTFDVSKAGTTLKSVKQVPFGVRGRKRKTVLLQHIGLQPNPDNRKLGDGAQTNDNADGQNLAVAGRSTTSTRRPRAMSGPLALEPIDERDERETTHDANSFDWSVMGNLRYSNSSDD